MLKLTPLPPPASSLPCRLSPQLLAQTRRAAAAPRGHAARLSAPLRELCCRAPVVPWPGSPAGTREAPSRGGGREEGALATPGTGVPGDAGPAEGSGEKAEEPDPASASGAHSGAPRRHGLTPSQTSAPRLRARSEPRSLAARGWNLPRFPSRAPAARPGPALPYPGGRGRLAARPGPAPPASLGRAGPRRAGAAGRSRCCDAARAAQ